MPCLFCQEHGQEREARAIEEQENYRRFGETVLIVSGSSARMASGLKDTPVDAAIIGIVDAVELKDPPAHAAG